MSAFNFGRRALTLVRAAIDGEREELRRTQDFRASMLFHLQHCLVFCDDVFRPCVPRASVLVKGRPRTKGAPKREKYAELTVSLRSWRGSWLSCQLTTLFRKAATSSTMESCRAQWANFAGEPPANAPCGVLLLKITIRSALGKGGGFKRTALTSEKIAVFAPMPTARATTAVAVNERPPWASVRSE